MTLWRKRIAALLLALGITHAAAAATGYDWRAIWGFAGGSREWNDDFSWFCFELIAAQIELGSAYRFPNRNRVTGKDLIEASRVLRGES